jgi:hypothetical protein
MPMFGTSKFDWYRLYYVLEFHNAQCLVQPLFVCCCSIKDEGKIHATWCGHHNVHSPCAKPSPSVIFCTVSVVVLASSLVGLVLGW